MAEQDRTLLKVMSGVQAGAEVALAPGEYSLGGGDDDDLQFIDSTLKPRHARLRVAPGKIEIRGDSGPVTSAAGHHAEAGDETWRELEPLDIVTVGSVRFALGPPTAQWTSLTEANDRPVPQGGPVPDVLPATPGTRRIASLPYLLPAVFFLLGMLGAYLWLAGPESARSLASRNPRQQMDAVQAALAPLEFARRLTLRQEVDGTIILTGFVETAVERRAVLGVLEPVAADIRVRVGVLHALRGEIDALVQAEKAGLTYTLEPDGTVRLEGLLLSEDRVNRLVERLKGTVIGITRVDSAIRTARTLLGEVEKLGQMSKIDAYVLFRLDNDLIEASGAVPTTKIDAWVGFLQSYSRRFAKDIGLRSLVRLQNPDGSAPVAVPQDQALVIGTPQPRSGEQAVDIERLRQGRFVLSDVFVAPPLSPISPAASAAMAATVATAPAIAAGPGIPAAADLPPAVSGTVSRLLPDGPSAPAPIPAPVATASIPPEKAGATRHLADMAPATSGITPLSDGVAGKDPAGKNPAGKNPAEESGQMATPAAPVIEGPSASRMARKADDLITEWRATRREGRSGAAGPTTAANPGLMTALDELSSARGRLADQVAPPERWLPLFGRDALRGGTEGACWPGSRLSPATLDTVLFWLDLLSVSGAMTLKQFDLDEQALILDAALNPGPTAECLSRLAGDRISTVPPSLYLAEAQRNPGFINYLAGSLAAYPLDVTGVNLGGRYLQTRAGARLGQGAAPDASSRLAIIGELGAAIRGPQGYSVVIYTQNLNWLVR